MTDRYFAIRLILRYGTAGAVVLAVGLFVGAAMLLWPALSWGALVPATLLGAILFLLGRSYVEIVSIVFSMVH